MNKISRLVVAVDVSADYDYLLSYAAYVAKKFMSTLYVIYVIPEMEWKFVDRNILHDYSNNELLKIKEFFQENTVNVVETKCSVGVPFKEIINYTKEKDADVVMIGFLKTGTTQLRLIRNISIPVWIVKSGSASKIKNILCPVDLGDMSSRAIQNSLFISKKMRADLKVVLAVEPLSEKFPLVSHSYAYSGKSAETLDEEYRHGKEHHFKRFLKKEIKMSTQDIDYLVCEGTASNVIIQNIKKHNIDLLIMGMSHTSWASRTIIGSTTEKVVHNLPCSMIIFK